MAIKKRGINPPPILALLFSVEEKDIGTVTDFQYPVIFPSEFSVLFPKISEYLRADPPLHAKTLKIRITLKVL